MINVAEGEGRKTSTDESLKLTKLHTPKKFVSLKHRSKHSSPSRFGSPILQASKKLLPISKKNSENSSQKNLVNAYGGGGSAGNIQEKSKSNSRPKSINSDISHSIEDHTYSMATMQQVDESSLEAGK